MLVEKHDMNGPLFHNGQAVTPVTPTKTWTTLKGDADTPKPQFGEVYHVKQSVFGIFFWWWIELVELPGNLYPQHEFAPVVDDDVLAKELQEIFEEELV